MSDRQLNSSNAGCNMQSFILHACMCRSVRDRSQDIVINELRFLPQWVAGSIEYTVKKVSKIYSKTPSNSNGNGA